MKMGVRETCFKNFSAGRYYFGKAQSNQRLFNQQTLHPDNAAQWATSMSQKKSPIQIIKILDPQKKNKIQMKSNSCSQFGDKR